MNSLDISDFTSEEIKFYNKIKPLKHKMCMTENYKNDDKYLNILYNTIHFRYHLEDKTLISNKSNINQISNSKGKKYYSNITAVLNNEGNVNINTIRNSYYPNDKMVSKYEEIPIRNISKVINISDKMNTFDAGVFIITKNKNYYIWEEKEEKDGKYVLNQLIVPFNIVQNAGRYYLTDTGEVYIRVDDSFEMTCDVTGQYKQIKDGRFGYQKIYGFYRIQGLPYISQITSSRRLLDINGEVHYFDDRYFKLYKLVDRKNIIQIFESRDGYQGFYYLDNEGNIFRENNDLSLNKIITIQNAIEIFVDDEFQFERNVYALTSDMKLYVHYSAQNHTDIYDLLNL